MNIFHLIVEKKSLKLVLPLISMSYIYNTGVFLAVCICTDMTMYATIEYNYNQ